MPAYSASGGGERKVRGRAAISHVAPVPSRRRVAVLGLATLHALCAIGAPFAGIARVGAATSLTQDYRVIADGFALVATSLLSAAVALGPLSRGERWAFFALLGATLAAHGGAALAHLATRGSSAPELCWHGAMLGGSALALWILRPPSARIV